MKLLSYDHVSAINLARALVWHKGGLEEWSPAEWGNAMAGEAGELCNVLKKILRHDHNINQANGLSREELVNMAAGEIADVYLYLDLVAQRLGLRLHECVVTKFNQTSEKEGFPHRL